MFKQYLHDEQFNFQINRIAAYGSFYMDESEIIKELPRIKDMDSWSIVWLELAERAEKEQRIGHALYYYRMAEFYLEDSSTEKELCYNKFRASFDRLNQHKDIERIEVPYKGTYLPSIRLKAVNEKGILLIHGGYDSFIEEFFPIIEQYRDKGYTLILFEGPGQGQARRNGLTFTHEWEKPTSTVIDYFQLKDVSLIGISWGGYLAPRAAAYDKRIKNVICYDIFYWGLDMLLHRMPEKDGKRMLLLLKLNMKPIINALIYKKMQQSIDLKWKISHGMYITGTSTPYNFLKSIDKHRLSDCLADVSQNVLLLAGEDDQYVPIKRMKDITDGLIHAKSITSHVFSKAEGGEQHCQTGAIQLAIEKIDDFLDKYCIG